MILFGIFFAECLKVTVVLQVKIWPLYVAVEKDVVMLCLQQGKMTCSAVRSEKCLVKKGKEYEKKGW